MAVYACRLACWLEMWASSLTVLAWSWRQRSCDPCCTRELTSSETLSGSSLMRCTMSMMQREEWCGRRLVHAIMGCFCFFGMSELIVAFSAFLVVLVACIVCFLTSLVVCVWGCLDRRCASVCSSACGRCTWFQICLHASGLTLVSVSVLNEIFPPSLSSLRICLLTDVTTY